MEDELARKRKKNDFIKTLDFMVLDVPAKDVEKCRLVGIDQVKEFCDKYGADSAIHYFKQNLIGVDPYHWLFFAMVGFHEIGPELRTYLSSENSNDSTNAALGLAYLGYQDGFEAVVETIKTEIKTPESGNLDLALQKEHLERMTDSRAADILNEYAEFFSKSL